MEGFTKEHAIETFRSLITIAVAALQMLVLLNGGAIVALLAYLGQLSSRSDLAGRVATPLAWFVAGLILAGLAFIGAYVTQLLLYGESVLKKKERHGIALRMTVIVSLLSVGAFAVGAFEGVAVLTAGSGARV